jgi:voltage-gated potassium channel
VIREELTRLFTWEERHRRLAARLLIAIGLTLVVLAIGSVLIWAFESGVKGGDIHGFGDAVFFTTVQLLTVSSAITNPLTAGGKVVDVALEAWAIFVVTAVAGSFASFSVPATPANEGPGPALRNYMTWPAREHSDQTTPGPIA